MARPLFCFTAVCGNHTCRQGIAHNITPSRHFVWRNVFLFNSIWMPGPDVVASLFVSSLTINYVCDQDGIHHLCSLVTYYQHLVPKPGRRRTRPSHWAPDWRGLLLENSKRCNYLWPRHSSTVKEKDISPYSTSDLKIDCHVPSQYHSNCLKQITHLVSFNHVHELCLDWLSKVRGSNLLNGNHSITVSILVCHFPSVNIC
jgi:hypothetical protein